MGSTGACATGVRRKGPRGAVGIGAAGWPGRALGRAPPEGAPGAPGTRRDDGTGPADVLGVGDEVAALGVADWLEGAALVGGTSALGAMSEFRVVPPPVSIATATAEAATTAATIGASTVALVCVPPVRPAGHHDVPVAVVPLVSCSIGAV